MKRGISAADANRNFSKLLRDVRDGGSYMITSQGKPVAKLVAVEARDHVRTAAKRMLLERLHAQRATPPIGRWTRDQLYEE